MADAVMSHSSLEPVAVGTIAQKHGAGWDIRFVS